jgi:ferredoxin
VKRLQVDPDLCQGHGRCYTLYPELCRSDESGFAVVIGTQLDPDQEHDAYEAVEVCPESAISVGEI